MKRLTEPLISPALWVLHGPHKTVPRSSVPVTEPSQSLKSELPYFELLLLEDFPPEEGAVIDAAFDLLEWEA